MLPPEEYFRSLPKKRSSSAVLLFKNNKMLILETSYQKEWSIAGGVVDANESPLEAVIRETMEEIGCKLIIKKLLCIDYDSGSEISGDATHFIFHGDIGNEEIKPCNSEIISYKWLEIEQAIEMMGNILGKRVFSALKAMNDGETYYCEDGQIIDYTSMRQ